MEIGLTWKYASNDTNKDIIQAKHHNLIINA